MVAPVEWVGVFGKTGIAKRKTRHAGVRSIVGQGFNQRVSWSALCTVDKGIAIATVGRIVQFTQAVITGEQVCRQVHVCVTICQARSDQEIEAIVKRRVMLRLKNRL
jgi:hypothetical protein